MRPNNALSTRWERNDQNDLICVKNGDESMRTVEISWNEFKDHPLTVEQVARLMNYAFKQGVEAKRCQFLDFLEPQ